MQANMIRHKDLYRQVSDKVNITKALINAMKGKPHYTEVRRISRNPQQYINDLHELLLTNQFKNSHYTTFLRNTGSKIREIYKLPLFPDRVVHHAIVQIMMPIWLNVMIRDTYATIPGRGIHDGVKRLKTALKYRLNTTYTLKFDIKKYYPSIDHDILLNILSRKVKDDDMMYLFEEIIRSAPGIPIGNYISQWFGNIYLAYFDHFCKEQLKCRYYFRYADDFVILNSDKHKLHQVLVDASKYLSDELKLQVKENHQVFPTNTRGIDFLGYRFYHTHTLVRKSIVKSYKRKLKHTELTGDRRRSQIDSYKGWLIHANTYNLRSKYESKEV